ncbi:MAG: DUF1499 domain-containing protein [Beijerinckiaceae bacterium]|jgi:hypothetical protein|nr:DUF1499 domain-containing protein [Beijerinckiaceae bacterium]
MRQHILDEPYSQAAIWSRRLAVFAILVAMIGLIVIRSNAVEIAAGIAVFGASILLACIALLLAGAAAVVIWRTGRKGVGHIIWAVLLSAAFLAFPAFLAVKAVQLPLLNDIATDVNDPPQFSASAGVVTARRGAVRSRELPGALAQQSAYADIQPIVMDLEAAEVYELVQSTVKSLGWTVLEAVPASEAKEAVYKTVRQRAGASRRTRTVTRQVLASAAQSARPGRIDAVARSLIMGFPDDITIRIRPLEAQTRIDIRSASRYGRHDFGANAARIRKFGEVLQDQLDAR